MRMLALIAASAVLLTGCAATEPVEGAHTLTSGGVERSYIVSAPTDLDEPAPLVVVLHGGFGSAEQAQDAYGWDELAASEGFVVAYPDGLGKAWNAGDGCCGASGNNGVDDVAFIADVVRSVERSTEIDASRIYVTGMSNGAMMSYRLACDTDVFAAIAPVAGTLLGSCDDPAQTSVLHIHGLADDSVHVDGSPGNGAVEIDGMPIAELNELWRSIDGCDEPTVTVEAPVTTTTAGCGDRDVTLLTVDGAGHQWPGSTRSRAQVRMGTDKPSNALDATTVIWQFFEAHPRV